MHRDLSEIRQFYQAPLGRLTARILGEKLAGFMGDQSLDPAPDHAVIGVGYTLPFFDYWIEQYPALAVQKHIAVMGAKQGVVRWPLHEPSRIVLTEDHVLPFADQSLETVLMVHAVENADYLRELMDEVWRVLKPHGRVVMVVPNRSGVWAKTDRTPFGHGRPFSMKQIRSLLYEAQFVIERDCRALYFVPSHNRALLFLAPLLERLGELMAPRLGGVTLIEAQKRIYNVTALPVTAPKVKIRTVKPDWVSEPLPT